MSKKPTPTTGAAAAYSGRKPLLLGLAALFALALPDLFLHKHTYFYAYEAWPGFFALLGLGAVAVLVGIARLIEALVRRGEDYYG